VHNVTTVEVERRMSVNSESTQETIQEIINNHEIDDDMTYNPFTPICSMGDNRKYEMPDANHAIALAFHDGYASEDTKGEISFIPTVYFVKRQTLMYCIDHPTNPMKKEVALQFIKNNFNHLYLCNDDDLLNQSLATYTKKKSQWHALLSFLGEIRVAGATSIYPPLSMVHFLDDKYQQKQMLGDATLPYFEVQLPLQNPLPADKGKNSWQAITWGMLYTDLLYDNDFPTIPGEALKGIVIKPRFGCGGNGIVVLWKVVSFRFPVPRLAIGFFTTWRAIISSLAFQIRSESSGQRPCTNSTSTCGRSPNSVDDLNSQGGSVSVRAGKSLSLTIH
jgi:hypothetical protein